MMNIQLERGLDGAERATGVAVIIDVFRAFTTACHAVEAGATPLLPAADLEQIDALRAAWPGAIAAGERLARPIPGCDFGNSPSDLAADPERLAGKAFIHATHAGTRGLLAARGAERVFAASLANARATATIIAASQPSQVTLVPMGWAGDGRAEEDDACAAYLRALLRGRNFPVARLRPRLKHARAAAKFFDPDQPWAPAGDFDLCLRVDAFPFALELERTAPPRLSPRFLVAQ